MALVSSISSQRVRNIQSWIQIILQVKDHSLEDPFASFFKSQLEELW